MIPDEAVEAAAKASWEKSNSDPWISGDHDDLRWADRRVYLDDARVILEAAAPHLMAAALRDAAAAIERDEDPRDALTIEWLRTRADDARG